MPRQSPGNDKQSEQALVKELKGLPPDKLEAIVGGTEDRRLSRIESELRRVSVAIERLTRTNVSTNTGVRPKRLYRRGRQWRVARAPAPEIGVPIDESPFIKPLEQSGLIHSLDESPFIQTGAPHDLSQHDAPDASRAQQIRGKYGSGLRDAEVALQAGVGQRLVDKIESLGLSQDETRSLLNRAYRNEKRGVRESTQLHALDDWATAGERTRAERDRQGTAPQTPDLKQDERVHEHINAPKASAEEHDRHGKRRIGLSDADIQRLAEAIAERMVTG